MNKQITPDEEKSRDIDYWFHSEYWNKIQNDEIMFWIKTYIRSRKTINTDYGSYSLKHRCEEDTGIYTHQEEFEKYMSEAGYETNENHYYKISKKPFNHRLYMKDQYGERKEREYYIRWTRHFKVDRRSNEVGKILRNLIEIINYDPIHTLNSEHIALDEWERYGWNNK